jgi:hypothetical protein
LNLFIVRVDSVDWPFYFFWMPLDAVRIKKSNQDDSLRAFRLKADEIRRAAQPARVNAALWV